MSSTHQQSTEKQTYLVTISAMVVVATTAAGTCYCRHHSTGPGTYVSPCSCSSCLSCFPCESCFSRSCWPLLLAACCHCCSHTAPAYAHLRHVGFKHIPYTGFLKHPPAPACLNRIFRIKPAQIHDMPCMHALRNACMHTLSAQAFSKLQAAHVSSLAFPIDQSQSDILN